MAISRIIQTLVSFIVGVILARYLGPEKFGLLSYSQSFVYIVMIVSNLGLDSIIVKEIVKDRYDVGKLLGTAMILRFSSALALIIVLVLWFYANGEQGSKEESIILILSLGYLAQSLFVIDFLFQARRQSFISASSLIISTVLTGAIKLLMIKLDYPIEIIATAFFIDPMILGISYLIFFKHNSKNDKSIRLKFNFVVANVIIKKSLPLLFTIAATALYMKIDQIMVYNFLGSDHAGIYAISLRITESFYFIPTIIGMLVFPSMVKWKDKSKKEYFFNIEKTYLLVTFLALIIALIITILSEFIILSLFGEAFLSAQSVLVVHIWCNVFIFLGVIFNLFLINEGFQMKVMKRSVIGLSTNIVLNYFFIRSFGIIGAAYATLISQFTVVILCDLYDKDIRPLIKHKLKALAIMPVLIKMFKLTY